MVIISFALGWIAGVVGMLMFGWWLSKKAEKGEDER